MNRNRKPDWPEGTPLPAVEPKVDPNMITQTRRYKLITPLFGGGVKPGEADPITVVRASEVRGHLRFWWRATRGGQFGGDPDKMRKAEEAIWGSAAGKDKPGPSIVNIRVYDWIDRPKLASVSVQKKGKTEVVDVGDPSSPYSYVAFPLRKTPDKPAGHLRQAGIEFSVEIRLTRTQVAVVLTRTESITLNLLDEVEAAIWAWETFGGIGARTRRGFGALHCLEMDDKPYQMPRSLDMNKWIENQLEHHVTSGPWPNNVPHLNRNVANSIRIRPKGGKHDADEAWQWLFGRFRAFRQDRYPKFGGPYGRSKWPEPDEVRRRAGTFADGYIKGTYKKHDPVHMVRKFPRGRFGLPIIFQFKDEDVKIGDPTPATLEGTYHDRYASRLILRPIMCSDKTAFGLACVLDGPPDPPGGYTLHLDPYTQVPVQANLVAPEPSQITPLGGESDVLKAFLDSL